MADVLSLPVSTSLLNEVNAVGDPGRLKAQDGTIGDKAHEQRPSDHNRDETGNTGSSSDSDSINEVHARDVDSRGPWKIEGGAERIVQLIVANVRARGYAERRVKYVIYRGRIWVWRKDNDSWWFVQENYTGADQHNEHFHVSFMYGAGAGKNNPENDTSPWGILAAYQQEGDIMAALTDAQQEDLYWRAQRIHLMVRNVERIMQGLARGDVSLPVWKDTETRFDYPALPVAPNAKLNALTSSVSALATAAGSDDIDEQAIATLVLAGLTQEKLSAAIMASGLTPAALAAAIPDALAGSVADELGRRISGTAQ